MYTFQDFSRDIKFTGIGGAVERAVRYHRNSSDYHTAITADRYDHQLNDTINNYRRWLYSATGAKREDTLSSSHRIASNFFRRLNTQRVTYSLGNGVTFTGDGVKEKLGQDFDTRLKAAGYDALIHGVSFIFWNIDHIHVFPLTEFAPVFDEITGALMAGVRFWQIDPDKPSCAVLYEVDGYTALTGSSSFAEFKPTEEGKRPYRFTTETSGISEEPEIVGEENYSALPIVPLYGSRLKQSTLIGLRAKIDAFDLVSSGFANDMADCAEIYWIVNNAGGMTDEDLAKFRDRLKLQHIANVEDADDVSVTPYTQQIPTAARKDFLAEIRSSIYEDFGALDVHTIAAGATNDHIDAAYQPLDENADDFEFQIIDAVQNLLKIIGIDDTPLFKRNRISNLKETTEMILMAAQYLDDATILKKLPFVTPDEIEGIMAEKADDTIRSFLGNGGQTSPEE